MPMLVERNITRMVCGLTSPIVFVARPGHTQHPSDDLVDPTPLTFMPATLRRFIDLNRRVSRWERSLVSRLIPGCAADGTVDFRDRCFPASSGPACACSTWAVGRSRQSHPP